MEHNHFPTKHEHHWTDEDLVEYELEHASTEDRTISDAAARVIASQFHDGQLSALYSFTSTGAIDREAFFSELARTMAGVEDEDVKKHLEALEQYAWTREDKGPQENWSKLWLTPPGEEVSDDRCSACGAHIAEPHSPECPLDRHVPRDDILPVAMEYFGEDVSLPELSARFLGEYPSRAAYVEDVMSEGDSLRALREAPIPEDLRQYITVDYDGIAEAMEIRGDIIVHEKDNGDVYIFNKRAF
ncbi:hypothetical protein RCF27_09175 [Rhodococcus pyridinivorans]|uniref:hypothetical protein n=1 Tax=Rhodococcus pyridinivorans TaxID=103816 RepID=UPI00280C18E4|nr:hypothetical protein [Rhodococcus pyridinivorans]WMM74429.1 hypothetical protein RCF27_09175 [Rhodococcus pyridinivorans]